MEEQLEQRWQLTQHFRFREEVFGGLAFDRDSFHVYRLSKTSYRLLSSLGDGPRSAPELADRWGLDEQEVIEFLQNLLKSRVVTPSPQDKAPPHLTFPPASLDLTDGEADLFRANNEFVSTLRAPLFLWWDITSACNFRCVYCYANSGHSLANELKFEDVRSILGDLAREGVLHIFFLGGEPYLRKDFVYILNATKEVGISSMLATNGWFITQNLARETKSAGVAIVRVSIDGAKPETHDQLRACKGSWHRAIRAIEHFKEAGIPIVGISPTVTPENLDEIPDLLRFAEGLGVDEIQLNPVCATGRGAHRPELSAKQALRLKGIVREFQNSFSVSQGPFLSAPEGIDDHKPAQCLIHRHGYNPIMLGCGSGRSCAAISADGDILTCILHRKKLGSVITTPFRSIWRDAPRVLDQRRKDPECRGCQYYDYCSGVCPILGGTSKICGQFRDKYKEKDRSTINLTS